jgi:hypothetical protein
MTEPAGGPFPLHVRHPASQTPQAFEASLTAVALSHHHCYTNLRPNQTRLHWANAKTHAPLPTPKPASTLSRRAHSAVTFCLCLPKPRRLLTNFWALLLLLIVRGFSFKLQKGEPRSRSDRQDVRGPCSSLQSNCGLNPRVPRVAILCLAMKCC